MCALALIFKRKGGIIEKTYYY